MASRNFRLHDGKKGVALALRVTPRANRNEISEILDDGTIKVRITLEAGHRSRRDRAQQARLGRGYGERRGPGPADGVYVVSVPVSDYDTGILQDACFLVCCGLPRPRQIYGGEVLTEAREQPPCRLHVIAILLAEILDHERFFKAYA